MSVYENLLNSINTNNYLTIGSYKVIELSFEDFNELCKKEEILNHYVELPVHEDVLSPSSNKDIVNLWSTLSLNVNEQLYIVTNTLGKDVFGGKDA